jgi:hypothetical protein
MGESTKHLVNLYKYPWKLEEKTKEKKERKNMEKYSINRPYCEGSRV